MSAPEIHPQIEMFPPELVAQIRVYIQATGHDAHTAVERLIGIGLATWHTDAYYMPERVCGRVRTEIHSHNRAN